MNCRKSRRNSHRRIAQKTKLLGRLLQIDCVQCHSDQVCCGYFQALSARKFSNENDDEMAFHLISQNVLVFLVLQRVWRHY